METTAGQMTVKQCVVANLWYIHFKAIQERIAPKPK